MSQTDVPLYDPNMLRRIDFSALAGPEDDGHAPRILLLYGSLRPQSYSRAVAEEGARVLRARHPEAAPAAARHEAGARRAADRRDVVRS